MNDDDLDQILSNLQPIDEPPDYTPEPGETYQPHRGAPGYKVLDISWQHPNHKIWAQMREDRLLQPPFYVRTPRGAVAWVPWPGAQPITEHEAAWPMDLLQPADPRFKKAK